eukprot:XP_001696230.1 predicted protein [Chlamydomonas reinhardtii]
MAAELPAAPAVAPPAPAVAAPAPAGPAKAADGSSSNHTTSKQLAPGQQQAVPPPPPSRTRRCFLTGAFPGLDVRLVVFTRAELERQQGPGGAPPLCWMWERLAVEAVQQQAATHVALEEWTAVGAAAWGLAPVTSVDVLVPCGRGRGSELRTIVEQCSSRVSPGSGVDVRFGVIVDTPQPLLAAAPVSGADGGGGPGGGGGGGRAELDALRDEHLGRMRLRWVLLDDDVVPGPGLVEAYVRAAARNKQALGFVGPTRLPAAGSAWAHAVHMSDVAFFWGAPASGLVGRRPDGTVWLPWCVTANMAVRNTHHRFDPRFPRTGGGEDIDFCLRACGGGGGGMLAVPEVRDPVRCPRCMRDMPIGTARSPSATT